MKILKAPEKLEDHYYYYISRYIQQKMKKAEIYRHGMKRLNKEYNEVYVMQRGMKITCVLTSENTKNRLNQGQSKEIKSHNYLFLF